MIAIIDYGAGNLSSVAKAIAWIGFQPVVTSLAREVLAAEAVVLPGVGAAGDAIARLKALGLTDAIARVVREDRPFLGICLGYQVLFSDTEEGNVKCLGLLPGRVVRLTGNLKVPHMGWNQVRQRIRHPIFEGIPDGADFYFVHSYYPDTSDPSIVAGETDYGATFCSLVVRGKLVASQFHPEKSGDHGLTMLRNFFRFAGISQPHRELAKGT